LAIEGVGELGYEHPLTGRRLRFRPADDEVMVSLRPGVRGPAAAAVADEPRAVRRGGPERGFALLAGPAARALRAAPVAGVLPALVDDDGGRRYFVPGEVLVQLRPGVEGDRAARLLSDAGSRILRERRTPGYLLAAVPEGTGLFAFLDQLAARDEVRFAEPSEVVFDITFAVPDDPDFPKLWGLHNSGQRVVGVRGTPGCDIHAPEAWDVTRGDPGVVVAVIDSGADLSHPDLVPNLLARGEEDWDFADREDRSPDDTTGHGSHVAGTAAAGSAVGVAPRCRLMPLRMDVATAETASCVDALAYVAAQSRARPDLRYVTNCSWGIGGDTPGVLSAIRDAVAANVVVVFACGNDHRDIDQQPRYPASYPETIAVAATDPNDRRAWFSNWGSAVDVCAPGTTIWSVARGGGHEYRLGTSMSAPHVAGTAALVRSRNRSLAVEEVRAILEGACDDVDARNPDVAGKLGHGRVNAARALAATPAGPAVGDAAA
jgi:subtilisin family serine protease